MSNVVQVNIIYNGTIALLHKILSNLSSAKEVTLHTLKSPKIPMNLNKLTPLRCF